MISPKEARIRLFPESVLRRKAETVTTFDAGLKRLVQTMETVMRAQRHGIGIAAPQVGVSLRVALVDVSSRIEEASLIVLVNPEIVEAGGECWSREGCMSLPEYMADLRRKEWVRLCWQDEHGKAHEKRFEGIEGICVQHEVDHLNGKLFLDRVVSLKTDMVPRGWKKARDKKA